MDDGVDAMLGEQARHKRLIFDVTDDKGGAPPTAQSKPVLRSSSTTTRSPVSRSV